MRQRNSKLLDHTLERPPGLIECDLVLDIGAGIRPMEWYEPKSHVCIEPHRPYAKLLAEEGFSVSQETAYTALFRGCVAEAIYLLDVIEHMEKAEGETVLDLALRRAIRQVVVYTPHGFLPQSGDAWEMGGEHWQEHRSGWLPDEFPGWLITEADEGFFAVMNV